MDLRSRSDYTEKLVDQEVTETFLQDVKDFNKAILQLISDN